MELVHCIYSSKAANPDLCQSELESILAVSRHNNSRLGITGILVYHQGNFFQVLEGHPTVIRQQFDIIARDERHQNVVKIIEEPIEKRSFGQWSMGFPAVNSDELSRVPGWSQFFRCDRALQEIDQGRARDLLAAFKEGRWRNSLRSLSAH